MNDSIFKEDRLKAHLGKKSTKLFDFLKANFMLFYDFHEQSMDDAYDELCLQHGPRFAVKWRTKQSFKEAFEEFQEGIKSYQKEAANSISGESDIEQQS